MSLPIVFSTLLSNAIKREIDIHAQELGDQLDGVEEVVGDSLSGDLYKEWSKLCEQYGFYAVTKEVKKRYL